jgi:glycosyltransferase involved in cell wall biosynthesis
MLVMQRHLRALGFQSEIFVEHVGTGLEGTVRPHFDYRPSRRDAFIVHHSMGHELGEWVKALPRPKLLAYHNVTPAEFFPEGSPTRHYAALGRRLLDEYLPHFDGAIAASELNALELRERGYNQVSVVPLLFDLDELRQAPWTLPDTDTESFTILFVGRLVENKRQHELVDVLHHLTRMTDRTARLVLVGGENGAYGQRVREQIAARGVEGRVLLTGKVPQAELIGWYRRADAFVCLSEHEGFGVPLIEAMAFDVPLVAYRSSSIAWTLGGAGLLLERKDPREIAALLVVLSEDRALRRVLLSGQRRRLEAFTSQRLREQLRTALSQANIHPRLSAAVEPARSAPEWQIEGPFETSYSLAIVNRELAGALERSEPGSTALFATEGPGDYLPKASDLAKLPELEPLWRRGGKGIGARRVIRNLYPPRVHDARGVTAVLNFFWEESLVPREWVDSFNHHLDLIAAPSRFVKKALLDSGVETPIAVVGTGVDHIARISAKPVDRPLGRGFRFLHVSSGFPRKGVDVLLRAYAKAFSSADDVTLVLKTFPNIHNTVARQLTELRHGNPRYPDVVFIDEDLPPSQLLDLYQQCHAFVAPSRGEGFGLPMAEAMWFGLPVITTEAGGQSDFCTEDTSWLVACRAASSQSHLSRHDSLWFEPDVGSLARALQAVHRATPAQRQAKTARARALVTREYTWDAVAHRLQHAVERLEATQAPNSRRMKLAWVSSWNTKCGIASYSEYLLRHLARDFDVGIFASRRDHPLTPDAENVRRCWDDWGTPSLEDLATELAAFGPDAVVFQFNFAFYGVPAFGRLVEALEQRGVTVLVIFHSTKDVNKPDIKASLRTISSELSKTSRLLVHALADVSLLESFGLTDNVTLFPHGVFNSKEVSVGMARERLRLPLDVPIVATYGFLLPHKGTDQLLAALPELQRRVPGTRLLMVNALYPNPVSNEQLARSREAMARLGIERSVTMITDFLSDDEALALLHCADVVVFPYQTTAESSSAAVRFGLSAHRPVACTPMEIFHDVQAVVHTLPGCDAGALARGIAELLADPARLSSKQQTQDEWLVSHAWDVLARRLRGLIGGLVGNRRFGELLAEPGKENDVGRAASAG